MKFKSKSKNILNPTVQWFLDTFNNSDEQDRQNLAAFVFKLFLTGAILATAYIAVMAYFVTHK